jgi:hypothetical protein
MKRYQVINYIVQENTLFHDDIIPLLHYYIITLIHYGDEYPETAIAFGSLGNINISRHS